jgi:hypothetical protein
MLEPSVRRNQIMIRSKMLIAVLVAAMLSVAGKANSDSCDATAAELVVREGAVVERRTSSDIILLKHPQVSVISLGCPSASRQFADLSLSLESAYPPSTFFDLAARTGHIVTGVGSETIRSGATQCQQNALRSKTEMAEMTFKGIVFECHAFSRSGGATTITFYRKTEVR